MNDDRVIHASGRWDEEELRRFFLRRFRRQMIIAAVIAIPVTVAAAYLIVRNVWTLILGAAAAFIVTTWSLLVGHAKRRARDAARQWLNSTAESHFMFDPEGFTLRSIGPDSAVTESRVGWSRYRRVTERAGRATLHAEAAFNDLLIPRRFFVDIQDWRDFLAMAQVGTATAAREPVNAPEPQVFREERGLGGSVQLTPLDLFAASRRHTRVRSLAGWLALVFVLFSLSSGGIEAIMFGDLRSGLVAVGVGASVVVGWLLLLHAMQFGTCYVGVWRAGRDRLSRHFMIDEGGIQITALDSSSTVAWSVFRRSGVTWDRLWLELDDVRVVILPRRCFASESDWQAAVSLVRSRAGKCPGCDYSLVGLSSHCCPECGYALRGDAPAAAVNVRTQWSR